jgi:hypothetical protein
MLATRCREAAQYEGKGLPVYVPQGLIIPFNGVSVPEGYERFDSMDNRQVVGAGSTYAAKSSGGAQCSISRTSAVAGAHSGQGNDFILAGSFFDCIYSTGNGLSENGGHSHGITAKYDREYQQLIFIKATAYHTKFPADAIVLGKTAATPVAGLTLCYDDDLILRSGAAIATGGGLSAKVCAYDGNHIHGTMDTKTNTNETSGPGAWHDGYAGLHSHDVTMAMTVEEIKRTYLTAWTKTSAFDGVAGIIAMWEGASPPQGWQLCDGNNGTLDLRDYFIILSSAAHAGEQHDDANRIYITASLDSKAWIHTHGALWRYLGLSEGGYISHSHGTFPDAHGHTSVDAWHNYTPPYYALTFIEKK